MELATFQPSKRDLAAVRKKVVDVPPRPSHAAPGMVSRGGRARSRVNRPVALGHGGGHCECSLLRKTTAVLDARPPPVCPTLEVRVRCPSSSLRGVVPHG